MRLGRPKMSTATPANGGLSWRRGIRNPKSAIRNPRCAGSIYLHVLASSLLITILGLGADGGGANPDAFGAVRARCGRGQGLHRLGDRAGPAAIRRNPNWRTERPNGTWFDNKELGAGRFTLQRLDFEDGSLSDSASRPVVLTGIGTKASPGTRRKLRSCPW